MMSVLIAVVMLFLVVVLHETAHAMAAARLGFSINHIFIGFPVFPKITIKRDSVPITISPWLLGGGVGIDEESFYQASFLKKFVVASSGPLTNLALGLVTALVVFGKTGVTISLEFVDATLKSVAMCFTGAIPLDQLMGPIGLAEVCTKIIKIEVLMGALFTWLLLNFAVGVLNLLPIPALDGGQIVLGAVSSIWKNSPGTIRLVKILSYVFLVIFLAGAVLLTIKDIARLFGFR
jgi:regulator of sigma E protease